MSPQDLLTAYAEVALKHRLDPMECAALTIDSRTITDPVTAWDALRLLGPRTGWLQFQSWIVAFAENQLPEVQPDWGYLLAAEAIDEAGRSLHLRQVGAGEFRLVVATPQTVGNAGQEVFLSDRIAHLATEKAPGKQLWYRRYWRLDPARGALPYFAAFQGFATTEDH